MSQSPSCCPGVVFGKYAALVVLIAGGAVGGLYLSGYRPWTHAAPPPQDVPSAQRFALTSFDLKDQHEAPSLAADSSGQVYLAWSSQTKEGERTVFLTRKDAGSQSFAEPTAISKAGVAKFVSQMKGKTVTRESRSVPHVNVSADVVNLAWTEALPDLSTVRMVIANSRDSGATFSEPQVVHKSLEARPSFTGFAAGADGRLVCTWLDNRSKSQTPYTAIRETGQTAFSEEIKLHEGEAGRGVCPCCPTTATVASDGTLYVAFRNIDNGYRDIVIMRRKPGETIFEGPFPVVPPTWKFDGCPHDGPSLAVVGDALHAVWMDAHTGTPRCYYAKASVRDMKFDAAEIDPSAVGSQGNAKLVADASGGLHVVFEQSGSVEPPVGDHRHGSSSGDRAIVYASKAAGDASFSKPVAVAPKQGAIQTRPAIAVTTKGERVITFNELDESGKSIVVTSVGGKACHE